MPTNPIYLHCSKCEAVMRLRNNYNSPIPSGSTATTFVNSTGTVNSSQIWYEYYCPNCGHVINSLVQYQEPD